MFVIVYESRMRRWADWCFILHCGRLQKASSKFKFLQWVNGC